MTEVNCLLGENRDQYVVFSSIPRPAGAGTAQRDSSCGRIRFAHNRARRRGIRRAESFHEGIGLLQVEHRLHGPGQRVLATVRSQLFTERVASTKGVAVVVTHGLVGWVLCGATMGLAMKVTTLKVALILHALAAPVIFAALSLVYFHRLGSWSPLRTAALFLGVVVVMDVIVVALFVERSFEMFESLLGTWLPFFLIFVSTWCTGLAVRRAAHGAAA